MSFNGTEGTPIDPGIAGEWTHKYQEQHPGGVRAYFAGRQIIEKMLGQPGAMGIRIYYGLDGDTPKLVLVSADQEENDQIGEGFIVADELCCCPSQCSQANILNM